MANTPERLADAQRALLDASHHIGLKTLEGITKLLELNMQVTRSVMSTGSGPMASLAQADPAQAAAAATLSPADAEAMTEYTRQLVEIMASTNGEIARLLQQQAMAMQSMLNEMVSAATGAVPVGNMAGGMPASGDALMAMMRNPMEAMQKSIMQTIGGMQSAAGAMQGGGSGGAGGSGTQSGPQG